MQDRTTDTIQIRPVKGIVPLNLHELWEYRELLVFLLMREVKGRHRQMALGPLWMVIGPLVNMALFTVLFGVIAGFSGRHSEGLPYPLFSYSALLPWGFFSMVMSATANSLLDNRALISKVYFPRLIVPLVGTFSAALNFAISFLILIGMMLAYGYVPTASILFVPLFLVLAGMTGLAVGLWWASWIVHFRDLNNVLQYMTKAWMYATPVVYASSLIPPRWQFLYHLNPMTNVVEGIRWALLGVGVSPGISLLWSTSIVIPILVGGAYFFRKAERNIVDIA